MALNNRFVTSIHALVLLAAEPEKLHRSEDVARVLHTNPVVVRRIFLRLQGAGLIVSHKGPSGGTTLARKAKSITLRDIHRALHPEGLLPAPSVSGMPRLRSALAAAFSSASREYENELDRTTLSQLVKKAAKRSKN
jgi:Rrf2 family protein